MSGEDVIRLEGTVVEVVKETLFRVEFPNGHQVLAHVSARHRPDVAGVKLGDKVKLQMSPFDFSKGRVVVEEKEHESPRIS